MMRASANRVRAERSGRRAELIATIFLFCKGYAIVARRLRFSAGEIDIAAKRGRLYVIVEVKARRAFEDAVFAVGDRARRRIERAAHAFVSTRKDAAACGLRYDIVAVKGWRVRHIRDAWRESDAAYSV